MKRLGTGTERERDEAELLAMLARAGLDVAPTVTLEADDDPSIAGDALEALDASDAVALGVLVRAAHPALTPFTAIVAHARAPLPWAREAAATIAESVGVPAARFLAGGATDTREALDATLDATVLRAARAPWPTELAARVAFLIARARARQPGARLMLQRLDGEGAHGVAASRDTRTGSVPVRGATTPGPLAIADGPSTPRPLAELAELEGARPTLEAAAARLEAEARGVVRFTFALRAGGPTFVSVAVQRRTARAACAIAADLARSAGPDRDLALSLVEPSDISACFTVRVDAATSAHVTSGVAAGGGIARGRAAFSTARALELARAGVAPVLVVPEVEPEDADAVRAASAIVVLRGGITGEAAIMARALGKPCVAAGSIVRRTRSDPGAPTASSVEELSAVTVDGATGRVFGGPVVLEPAEPPGEASTLLALAEDAEPSVVHAMVTCPEDLETARRFGAARVVLWDLEELVFAALRDPGAPAETVAARVSAVLDGAARLGLPAAIRVVAATPTLVAAAGGDGSDAARAADGLRSALDGHRDGVEVVLDPNGGSAVPDGVPTTPVSATDAQGARAWSPFFEGSRASVAVVVDARALAAAASAGALEIACPPALVPAARFALARRRRVYRPSSA